MTPPRRDVRARVIGDVLTDEDVLIHPRKGAAIRATAFSRTGSEWSSAVRRRNR